MINIKSHLLEFVIGIFLFGAGLLFLNKEYQILQRLTNSVNAEVLESKDLYQQYNSATIDDVPSEELCAIIMGYREYPITIDGTTMGTDEENNLYYLGLVKDGYYIKDYDCDSENKIIRVVYRFSGVA